MSFKEKAIAALEEMKGDTTGIICATIDDCQKVIRELPEDGGWISVEERLPENGMILTTDGERLSLIYASWLYEQRREADITHWMPLPELPKEEP